MKTKNDLFALAEEIVDLGVPASLVKTNTGDIAFRIEGFSKSGSATLSIHDGNIICHTRYDTQHEVETAHDVSRVAFSWYCDYRDRIPFDKPDPLWVDDWVNRGWLIKESIVQYTQPNSHR